MLVLYESQNFETISLNYRSLHSHKMLVKWCRPKSEWYNSTWKLNILIYLREKIFWTIAFQSVVVLGKLRWTVLNSLIKSTLTALEVSDSWFGVFLRAATADRCDRETPLTFGTESAY